MALLLRVPFRGHENDDYLAFLLPWWNFIDSHGGFAALKYEFSDYNVPYLYVMAALTYVSSAPLLALKAVSVLADVVTAYFAYRLATLAFHNRAAAAAAGVSVLLLPTVIFDSSMWAQCDSLYSAFTLAGFYYVLRDRPWLGMGLVGAGYAFKQQTMFFFPVLLLLILCGQHLKWRHLTAIPAVFVAAAIPAWIAGRPLSSLLMIYVSQTKTYGGLNYNAPSAYGLVDVNLVSGSARSAGTLLAGAVVLGITLLLTLAKPRITPAFAILAGAFFTLLVPFLLPAMHERYFYLGAVLVTMAAFLRPRLFLAALLVQLATLAAYGPYLFKVEILDMRLAAAMMLAGIAMVGRVLAMEAGVSRLFANATVAAEGEAGPGTRQ
jgi:Gpi18-like mannosyltransferase